MGKCISSGAFVALLLLVFVFSRAEAQDPKQTISFQGYLTDDVGGALTDIVSITFKLYIPPSANPEWTEVHPSVSVVNGYFNVALGSIVDLAGLSFDRNLELGISVDGDPEIVPRTNLTAAPFAMNLRGALRVQLVDDNVGTQVFDSDNIVGGKGWVDADAVGVAILGGGNSDDFDTRNRGYGNYGTIGGGWGNAVGGNDSETTEPDDNPYATVGGGRDNEAFGTYSTVGGGVGNVARGAWSTVGGGDANVAHGTYSTVPGGWFNEANGRYGFAAGYWAVSDHRGAYVWSDSSGTTFTSSGDWQYLIRAKGGVGIGTAYPSGQLVKARPGQASAYQLELRNEGSITIPNHDGIRFTQVTNPSDTPTNLAWIKVPYQNFGGADMELGLRFHNEPILYLKNMGNVGGTPVRVGVGTNTPSVELDVNGALEAVSVTETSDARYKREVTDISGALDAVLALHGVRYYWDRESYPERAFGDGAQIGFLAQEVREVVPEVVSEGDDSALSVAYTKLVPLLVEAIKEQNARIQTLEEEIQLLKFGQQ